MCVRLKAEEMDADSASRKTFLGAIRNGGP